MLVAALLLLLPAGLVHGQADNPALARLVRPVPGTRPLGVVLAELSRQGHLPLSYSSSLVPVAHPAHLAAGPARPLGIVLEELLAAEHLSFGFLNGQLVLWPAHLAVPAGVVAASSRPAQAVKLAHSAAVAATAVVAPATSTANGTASSTGIGTTNRMVRSTNSGITREATSRAAASTAAGSRFVGPTTAGAWPGGSPTSSLTKPTNRATARPGALAANGTAPRPLSSVSATASASQRSTEAANSLGAPAAGASSAAGRAASAAVGGAALHKQVAATIPIKAPAASRPTAGLRGARALAARQTGRLTGTEAPLGLAAAGGLARNPANASARQRVAAPPAAGRELAAGREPAAGSPTADGALSPAGSGPLPAREPVALLTAKPIAPTSAAGPSPLLPMLPTSAVREPELVRSPSANPDNPAAPAKPPFVLASLLRPSYLHAEAWTSETLPLNAALKVGTPRIYLALGVAGGPVGRGPGGGGGEVAGGAGLGTVGQPRGRFTPSLDLMHWFLAGDRDGPGSQLTQLRPLLAWQIKPGGRLQLIGGPSLNLATGSRRAGGPPRGDGELGQGQWLWLNSGDERSFLRLWPGVQLGLRF